MTDSAKLGLLRLGLGRLGWRGTVEPPAAEAQSVRFTTKTKARTRFATRRAKR